ncbi:MAG: tRNA (adenosine(37)-N6)-dimethylallyltransferase MiaA [Ignavibacteria bacterium]|nr:tRNA (adenosine(37)-N6)-dimethylallyltransferase MiaA [Ignavibacteria bacterium]
MKKDQSIQKAVYAIVGPTASGKTGLSIELARLLDAEIINCDSRQIYKHIQIATCAPTKLELKEIKHYFVNELELDEDFSAGEFAKRAKQKIKDILKRKKKVLIVGGSGLYLKALIEGFYEDEISDAEIRSELNRKLESKGREVLYKELMKVDPETASKMDSGKTRRVIRALEVFYASGKKISDLQKINTKPEFSTIQAGLYYHRPVLYKRINDRVDIMIKNGLLDEVKKLQDKGYSYKTHNSLNTVGIKEVFMHFEGALSLQEMTDMIKMNSRRYAKRQMTWFRKDKHIKWVDMDELQGNIGAISYMLNECFR